MNSFHDISKHDYASSILAPFLALLKGEFDLFKRHPSHILNFINKLKGY